MLKNLVLRFFIATALAVALCTVLAAQEFSATAEDVAEWRTAAEKGEAWAQHNLGYAYDTGKGVTEDKHEAARWYRKAAEQGLAEAQYNLGYAYYYGEGIAEDKREAVRWYRKAAEQGIAWAQYNLGYAYSNGEGIAEDKYEAVRWYRKAAEQGFAKAQHNLGYAYDTGKGVTEDERESARWWRKAAEQGFAQSQFNLGQFYYFGKGVVADKREAVRWWRKAAEQGHAWAQTKLGVAYAAGEGIITDVREAYIWLSIAKVNGNDSAPDALHTLTRQNEFTQSETRSIHKEAAQRLEEIDHRIAENLSAENRAGRNFALAPKPNAGNPATRVFESTWRSVVVVVSRNSQGSGVIVRPNIVATNCHVIESGADITVYKAAENRAVTDTKFTATIRRSDYNKDFCLLDVKNLRGVAATVRKYNTLVIGENVYGIGAPKGLDLSLSAGVISQLRERDGNRFIQTDTAISPGSSGGGLFDSEGNLIGIMTSKITDESTEGIGFAIPADLVLGHQQ